MLLTDQDEDRQFWSPGGPQVRGLHADVPFFQLGGVQSRGDEGPKLRLSGKHCKKCACLLV